MTRRILLAAAPVLLGAGFGLTTFAQRPAATDKAAGEIEATAKKFLATLDDAQRAKVVFDFKDEAQRKRWSNLPTTMVKREGLRMGDLTRPQRDAAMAVLEAALSPQGYEKVLQIVEADEVLKKCSGGRGPTFGRDEYYVSFLGQPSAADPWMIQFGGHHLGLNITLAGDQRHTRAEPHRRAAGDLRDRRQDHATARPRDRQGLCPDRARSTKPSASRRSSASRCATSCSAPVATGRRFSRKGSKARPD